jgi:hypothetical protein
MAKFIAMVIRNAMEDFHCRHLSDAQVRELNPIIRNAIYTALHAAANIVTSEAAEKFVQFQAAFTPDYWEDPELLADYIKTEKFCKKKAIKKSHERKRSESLRRRSSPLAKSSHGEDYIGYPLGRTR